MKNMMVLLVMFILGGQSMGQVIPVEYQKQEVFLHRYMDACPASITTIKPYQEIEMTAKEIVIYNQVKDVVTHVHIKDAKYPEGGDDPKYTFPGEGDAYVKEILENLKYQDQKKTLQYYVLFAKT